MTEMVELAHKSVKTAIVAMLQYSKQNTYSEKRMSLRSRDNFKDRSKLSISEINF